MASVSSRARAFRIASWITALNVLIASGFSIAGLLRPESILPAGYVPTNASLIFALYAAARTIPLACVVFVAIYKRWISALVVLGSLAGGVQFLDSIVGLVQQDPGKTYGPFVIALFQLYAVIRLVRSN
ncbi:hypothetical protein [Granulicella mallensis]|jgi:hypothetical protein|uniref:DoxX family protein n=1 Tax=Granulicella mallensis (strain ATCC BAA-1857 / DSM 23137 / MP5ACTX8) TaxID=682795 RepID=G8NQS3_GRAMM|nr:hypothetical protein [Granulicella mallensis]AEU38386.1 hypothetical protein AciX8_4105 [Granulicella mallensis MP5ACTX8]